MKKKEGIPEIRNAGTQRVQALRQQTAPKKGTVRRGGDLRSEGKR